MVNKPAILLADEPTGNLDPATSREIMRVLRRINRNGTAVIMATHDVSIVDEAKQRVLELLEGRLVRDETGGVYTPEIVLYEEPESPEVVEAAPARPTIAEVMAERVAGTDSAARAKPNDARPGDIDSPTTRLPEHEEEADDWAAADEKEAR